MNASINKLIDNYWDNYRGGLKTIIEVSLYITWIYVCSVNSLLSNIFSVLILVDIIYKLYKIVKYRNGNGNFLPIPTQNDNYSKTTSIVVGSVIISIIFLIVMNGEVNYLIITILCLIGVMILITGIYKIPGCIIEIENAKIKIQNYKTDQENLKLIEIKANRILLTYIHGKREQVDNLNIDFEYGERIRQYILTKTNSSTLSVVNLISNM